MFNWSQYASYIFFGSNACNSTPFHIVVTQYSILIYFESKREKDYYLDLTLNYFIFYYGRQKELVILISRLPLRLYRMHVIASFDWISTSLHSHEWNEQSTNSVGAKVFWPLIILCFQKKLKQLEKQRKKSYNVTKSYMKKFEGKKTINF